MKKSRFTDSQIMSILKQAEAGTPVAELCREHSMSSASFYKWRSTFGGMDMALMSRLKEPEEENHRLKICMLKSDLRTKLFRRPWQKSGEVIRSDDLTHHIWSLSQCKVFSAMIKTSNCSYLNDLREAISYADDG